MSPEIANTCNFFVTNGFFSLQKHVNALLNGCQLVIFDVSIKDLV
jgi:hypothetical protein